MHIAIIMDGNGRWASRRHLPRTAGHRAGAKAVKGNGGKLILLSPDEYVRDVLNTAGIDLVMPIMFDRNDAIAAVRQ